jgi:hypothetical protein
MNSLGRLPDRFLKIVVVSLISFLPLTGCNSQNQNQPEEKIRPFPKNIPLALDAQIVSTVLKDMERFVKALRPMDSVRLKQLDDRYKDVRFLTQQKPLFTNVYPEPSGKRVIFLLVPKDPETGTTYLLHFDQELPVVKSKVLELQLRKINPEDPLTCYLSPPDPNAYIQDVRSHLFSVRYILYKKFLQAGSFDFDALSIPTYRTRGYPFIVFDIVKGELIDTTAKLTCECR